MNSGRENLKFIWGFSLCGFAAIFSSTISKTPVLPLYASHLGANDAQVGWIAAVSTIPGIFISYLAGYLSDRYGWKSILLISLFIFATAPFLYLLVREPVQLATVRFYHGFATAIFGPVAMTAIVSLSGKKKGEMLSLYSSSTMVGRALGPLIGGLLLASWGYTGVFWVCAVAGTAAMVIGAGFWGRTAQNGKGIELDKSIKDSQSTAVNLWCLLCCKGLLLVGILEAAMFFTYGAFEIIFPLYAKEQGLAVWVIGFILCLQLTGVIIFKPFFGRLSDRVGRIPVILTGLMICTISLGGISFWQNFYFIGLLNIGFGIGFALVTSSTRPLATEIVRHGQAGASLGILSTMMDMGQVAGPPIIGAVASFYGYQSGFLMLAALMGILVICGYLIKSTFPHTFVYIDDLAEHKKGSA